MYRKVIIDLIKLPQGFPEKLSKFRDRYVEFLSDIVEKKKNELLQKDPEYMERFPQISFENWIKSLHNYNVDRWNVDKWINQKQDDDMWAEKFIYNGEEPKIPKELIDADIPMWEWCCNHHSSSEGKNPPFLKIPEFDLQMEDCPQYDMLQENHKMLVFKWNNEERGFADILNGKWQGNDKPRDPPPISLDDLEIIAPFLDKRMGYSWWNQEVPIHNNVTNTASDQQLTILMKHDSRGQLSVSYDNNMLLGSALCKVAAKSGSPDIDNCEYERIVVLIGHPSFKFNTFTTIGNGYQSPYEQTPIYRFLNHTNCDSETHTPIKPTMKDMEIRINYMFNKLLPLLNKEDQLIAIAEGFFWAKKQSKIEVIKLLINNIQQIQKNYNK